MKTRCVQHSAHTHTQSWELLWKERKIERARNEREKRASSPVRLSEKQQPVVLVLHTHPAERDPIRVTASYTMGLTEGNGRCTLLSLWNMAAQPTNFFGWIWLFPFYSILALLSFADNEFAGSHFEPYTNRKRPEVFSFDNMRDAERSAIFERTQKWENSPDTFPAGKFQRVCIYRRTTFFSEENNINQLWCGRLFFLPILIRFLS